MKTVLQLRIAPNARRSEVVGRHGESIKVKIQAAPVDGKANGALLQFLAGKLRVPARSVRLCGGEKSRDKRVEIHGLDLPEIETRLGLRPESGSV